MPFKTLETKICAMPPRSLMVRSHGPSSNVGSANVVTTLPLPSTICRAPGPTTLVPFFVGTLPTTTNPARNAPSAVVKPSSLLVKKVTALPGCATAPFGVSLMMVVPSPCRFFLLLKFETSTSPGVKVPAGNPSGTKTIP